MLYFKLGEEVLTTLTMYSKTKNENVVVRCKILEIHCDLYLGSSTFKVEVLEILNEEYNKKLRSGVVLDMPQSLCKKIHRPSTLTFEEIKNLKVPR